jgi:hypothetical protein
MQALATKRSSRRAREERQRTRTQPEQPRLMLSTLPFLALFALLGVLTVAIILLAFPGNQAPHHPRGVAPAERGVAPRGWFQDAQKDMRR